MSKRFSGNARFAWNAPSRRRSGSAARDGFTYLELQVAFVLFALALSGVGPLVIMYSRQTGELENRLRDEQTHYITPQETMWERRLGAVPDFGDTPGASTITEPNTLIELLEAGMTGGSAGYSDWAWSNHPAARGGRYLTNRADNEGDWIRWTFTGLKPGYYEAFVTFPGTWSHVNDATYTLFDGPTVRGTTTVDQRIAPTGEWFDGSPWQSLGTIAVTSGTFAIRLTDDAGWQYIAISAARIAEVKNDITILSFDRAMDSENVSVTVQVQENVP
ncbi:MAG: hypothetical protein KDA60_08185 [Planctomycetales bacterium]|nr:hypothetical protein [Planctomycetales bacterium]